MAKDVQHPPAFCPVHGLFPAEVLALGIGVKNISLEGLSTDCPICGRMSEIIPGTYEALPDRLNLLLDPSISPEALAALQDIAGRLSRKEITAEEAASEAGAIDQRFSRALWVAAQIGGWAITAVMALLSLYLQIQSGNASSEQGNAILKALTEQTSVLERIATELSEEKAGDMSAPKVERADEQQRKAEPTTARPKSQRRQVVNRERRAALKLRRQQFNPKPH